jgi:hypothetical protein
VIPFIAASSGYMFTLRGRVDRAMRELYATSGSIAEESISAIRTVVSFNGQKKGTRYLKQFPNITTPVYLQLVPMESKNRYLLVLELD